jgi:peptidoglycan/xylan/chitin deacetylase (PgdA/CDA1 family)
MKVKRFLTMMLALFFAFSSSAVNAERISDYEFEKGNSNLVVNNRSAKKCVALTFDDGPHPKYTPEILDILKKYGAKATFFVVGSNALLYPDIVKSEAEQGHEIGNHTFSHPDLKKISASDFIDEVRKTSDVIYNITGKTPKLFRPPGGYLNNDIVKEIIECDGKPVLWSWRQDTRDWACPSADCIVETVIENLKDGDIILFHDYNAGSSPTPVALERILKELSEDGYRFVTVSELMSI